MRNRTLKRQKLFDKKKVELDFEDAVGFTLRELSRQISKKKMDIHLAVPVENKFMNKIHVVKQDPFLSITINQNGKILYGFAKRMPNDIPNDCIAIQVAVRDLLRNLSKK